MNNQELRGKEEKGIEEEENRTRHRSSGLLPRRPPPTLVRLARRGFSTGSTRRYNGGKWLKI